MKTTVVIVIVCVMSLTEAALTLTSQQKEKLDKTKAECKGQTGVSVDTLKQVLDGKFPDDPKFADFLGCVAKKINFQNEAGEFQKDVIIEKLGTSINDPAKAKQLTEKCIPNNNPSDSAYQFAKCVYDSTPNHIVIVQ